MNAYSTLTHRLTDYLQTELQSLGYAHAEARRGIWKPGALQPFERYLVFVAPATADPWSERRISTKEVAYVFRSEIFLLVKNYDDVHAIFGDTAPDLGVFQLMHDVKALLRSTDLGGLLDRTYRETEGGSGFDTGAMTGFDSGTHGWVHRAKLVYVAQTHAFCHPS
ncbi:hypothetical protein BH24ACT15_BH24ACT15_34860 [soil metagenome]